jgi:hypothetical protein
MQRSRFSVRFRSITAHTPKTETAKSRASEQDDAQIASYGTEDAIELHCDAREWPSDERRFGL